MTSTEKLDDWNIPLYKIYTDDEDVNLITKIVKRGNTWAIGPEIEEFEKSLAEYVGSTYCLTLNSGTSSLHASFLALDFKKNDEIIVPSFSFISTSNSVLFVDSTPVFADIENETFGLDPDDVSSKISEKTKAIVPMDYGGNPCKIPELKKVAKDNDLFLIEDAAEALGSSINGKKIGSMSDISIFSFCGNKVITTGEGGAITTDSKSVYEKIKLIRSHGRSDKIQYFNNPSDSQYTQLGYNWRMSSITAALGISQLNKLDKIVQMRQKNAEELTSKLKKFPQIKTTNVDSTRKNIFQMYTVRLDSQQLRDDLHQFLLKKRIFSKIYFNPIHLSDFYKSRFHLELGSLPKTEQISSQVLTLPLYPNMTTEEKEFLIHSISDFFENLS